MTLLCALTATSICSLDWGVVFSVLFLCATCWVKLAGCLCTHALLAAYILDSSHCNLPAFAKLGQRAIRKTVRSLALICYAVAQIVLTFSITIQQIWLVRSLHVHQYCWNRAGLKCTTCIISMYCMTTKRQPCAQGIAASSPSWSAWLQRPWYESLQCLCRHTWILSHPVHDTDWKNPGLTVHQDFLQELWSHAQDTPFLLELIITY